MDSKRIALAAWATMAALAPGLAYAGMSASMKAYLVLKQDPDHFVGEGTVDTKDFGSKAKALEAARIRAQAALAESVKVHISSEASESLKSGDGKASEQLESKAQSKSDVDLENVNFMEMLEFPEAGQVTVLAYLSKEDYRRQLAGKKVSVYLPEHGLKIKTTVDGPNWLVGHYQPGLNLGLEYLLGNVELGGEFETDTVDSPDDHGLKSGSAYSGQPSPQVTRFSGELGYNWTPWAVRNQVFFPMRLHYQHANTSNLSADLFGASAGLGYRYWPSDGFALELQARYALGFNTIEMQPYPAGFDPLQANLTGLQFEVGLLWSGF